MGVMDLPAPLFGWVDAGLADFLPSLARIVIWGVIAGVVSMGLYGMISPQRRLAEIKRDMAETRQALDDCDGETSRAGPLLRRLLRLSVTQVGMTLLPTLAASLPVLMVLAWVSTAYGYSFPAASGAAAVDVRPAHLQAELHEPTAGGRPHRIIVTDGNGSRVADLTLAAPVGILHRRQWWNLLVGNPAGYLPRNGAVDLVRLTLPRQQHLVFGPGWARGWEPAFFIALICASLGLKIGARIH
ncbi:MAG: hypothetical protein WED00_13440 [Aquisalimonadaceae bacterium]